MWVIKKSNFCEFQFLEIEILKKINTHTHTHTYIYILGLSKQPEDLAKSTCHSQIQHLRPSVMGLNLWNPTPASRVASFSL